MKTTSEPMRLQKYLARAGVASRRASEQMILEGRVTVNDRTISELGVKVIPGFDEIRVDGKLIVFEPEHVVVMLNKPSGYLTSMKDDRGRHCVAELVPIERFPGLFPIGRLDLDTTGLLLFTTDGELGNALLHPSRHVDKVYEALVRGLPNAAELKRLREGVQLEDGRTAPACVSIVKRIGDTALLSITIHEGKKRQVKRMCEAVGHPVVRLNRTKFGSAELGNLPLGAHRLLSEDEIAQLSSCVR